MQNKSLINLLAVIKTRVRRVQKTFRLGPAPKGTPKSSLKKFLDSREAFVRAFSTVMRQSLIVSFGRIRSLSARMKHSQKFMSFVYKMYQNHGSSFTVQWLKACHVALQRYIGHNPMSSLRELNPKIPLPRLINGCPAIISSADRKLIREGHLGIMRMWLSLFSVYRVIDIPGSLKLETITDSFKGEMSYLLDLITLSQSKPHLWFSRVKGYNELSKKIKLMPTTFVLSRRASPNSDISAFGILLDAMMWNRMPEDNPLNRFFHVVGAAGFKSRFPNLMRNLAELGDQLVLAGLMKLPKHQSLKSENVVFNYDSLISGQLALKNEPAGKVRVFAMVDSVTQSVLNPLHQHLFSILRLLPNDGTFDQQASVTRSMEKAKLSGMAYSFDLSAATDRLPAKLSAAILENLVQVPGFGQAWLDLLVDRDYEIDHSMTGFRKLRYAVGQPMGGLSSWAALAITHHWIVQTASYQIGNKFTWEDRYEILGDDLVIFDRALAEQYLIIAKGIGVEINMSKSISSPIAVFEFAKQTSFNGNLVSGPSYQQLLSNSSMGERVTNVLSLAGKGFVRSVSVLATLLVRFVKPKTLKSLLNDVKELGLPSLAVLSAMHHKGAVQHRLLLEALVNPNYKDFDFTDAKFSLPIRALLKLDLELLNGEFKGEYPFSQEEFRNEIFSDYESDLSAVVLQTALAKSKALEREYDIIISKGAMNLARVGAKKSEKEKNKVIELNPQERLFKAQLEGLWEDIIVDWHGDFDVADLVDEVESTLYDHAKYQNCSFTDALEILDKVETACYRYIYNTGTAKKRFETSTSPVVMLLRKSLGAMKSSYWQHHRPKELD